MKRNLLKKKEPEQQPLHFEGERFRCNLCGFVSETPPGCASCDPDIAKSQKEPFGRQVQSFEFLVDPKLPLSEGKPKGVQRKMLVRSKIVTKEVKQAVVGPGVKLVRRHILIRKPPETVKIEQPQRKLLIRRK